MKEKHGIQETDPTEKNSKGEFKGESCEACHERNHLDRGLKKEVSRKKKNRNYRLSVDLGGGSILPACTTAISHLYIPLDFVWAAISPAPRMNWNWPKPVMETHSQMPIIHRIQTCDRFWPMRYKRKTSWGYKEFLSWEKRGIKGKAPGLTPVIFLPVPACMV